VVFSYLPELILRTRQYNDNKRGEKTMKIRDVGAFFLNQERDDIRAERQDFILRRAHMGSRSANEGKKTSTLIPGLIQKGKKS